MSNSPAAGTKTLSLDRIHSQATESIHAESRRMHEASERFREQYRRRLDEWMEQRARLDRRGGLRPAGPDSLRAEHDQLGRELTTLRALLKRLDVAARHLDVLGSYLAATDPHGEEPSLTDADDSPEAVTLRIIHAQEGERQRLAEEIHDGPAQVLTNAIFQVEYLERMMDSEPGEARAELEFLRSTLRNGLDEVRGFITELRPPAVDVGLAQAIADRASEFETRHGIIVTVDVAGIDQRLTPAGKTSVLRIVQESLQNVRKHAAASQVSIGLEGGTLTISDNGRGFDVMRLASGVSRNFGLQFMRERAELMGGQLQIESRQGEGTRILLRLPERSER